MNWANQEPNNTGGTENSGHIYSLCQPQGRGGRWNDADGAPRGYTGPGIVEREVDPAVPTVSTWGVVVMALLTLAAGTWCCGRNGQGVTTQPHQGTWSLGWQAVSEPRQFKKGLIDTVLRRWQLACRCLSP